MVIKPILSRIVKGDGTSRVHIYIYSCGDKAELPTEHFIRPEHFKGKVVKHPNADYLNAVIQEHINKVQRHALSHPGITPKELKAYFEGSGKVSLFDFADEFIAGIKLGNILIKGKRSVNKGRPYAFNTCKTYVTYTNYLKEFNPKLNWQDITEEFYNDYVVWMRDNDYAENTIAKAIKILCSIMARGEKNHNNNAYKEFEASYVDTDAIFLNEDEIFMIQKAELPPHLDSERRRFLLSYNFFLRFGDSISVDKKDVFLEAGKQFAKFSNEKTGNHAIIPLLPFTFRLLHECDFKLPATTNQEANWKLKEIGRLAGIDSPFTMTKLHRGRLQKSTEPKYKFITTHTARRSMATNLYLAMKREGNVDLKAIQLMGAWKSVSMLEKYLKVDRLANAISISSHSFFSNTA